MNVHRSMIHSSPQTGSNPNVHQLVSPSNGILPAIKRNNLLIYATTWMNLIKHYAKQNKPDVKDNILHEIFREGKYVVTENLSMVPGTVHESRNSTWA